MQQNWPAVLTRPDEYLAALRSISQAFGMVGNPLPTSYRDVPQHVVQKILDHDSAEMTALYVRLSDKTVREHWERARKVGASGQPVQINPDGPLGDAAWTGQQLSRATQSLPNGYCQLPVVKTCPHANAPLTELTTMFRQFMACFRLLALICPRD